MKKIQDHYEKWKKNFKYYNLLDIDFNTYLIMNKIVKNIYYQNGKPIYELYEKEQQYKPKKKAIKSKKYFTKIKNSK
jgi:hypothetical protein